MPTESSNMFTSDYFVFYVSCMEILGRSFAAEGRRAENHG